ncbi:MAG: hypothetical protein CM15mP109_01430 [Candidatus Dadabacteria bacterium]|nr:MAG: hypothetical protein CM15mP109_01430 [Candidatus Dadabacteria bacterium]
MKSRKRFRSLEKGGGLPNTDNIRLAKNNLNNHLKYFEFLLERRFWLVNSKIELADLTAAAHISCIDYLGDMPWEKFPEIKHWYSRIKSRPSFRSILTDKIIGIPPREIMHSLISKEKIKKKSKNLDLI